jgi:ABC-type sugar transport system substrate-binding protein
VSGPSPGYRTLVGPTHDWRRPAPDAFVWVAYGPPGADGLSDRTCGFASTFEAAAEIARLRGTLADVARFEHVAAADSVVNALGRAAREALEDETSL